MTGAERDRQEHEEALKRFNGKQPEGNPVPEILLHRKRCFVRFTNWWGDHYGHSPAVRRQKRIYYSSLHFLTQSADNR